MQLYLALLLILTFCATSSVAVFRQFMRQPNWPLSQRASFSSQDHDITSIDLGPFLRTSPLDAIFGISNNRRISAPKGTKEVTKKADPSKVHWEQEDIDGDESREKPKEVFVEPPTRPDAENEKEPEDKDVPIIFNSFPFRPVSFSFGLFTPWWKGPNVCEERSEVDESDPDDTGSSGFIMNFEATQCSQTETTYTCTKKIRNSGVRKTIVVKHQCCHGFGKRTDGKPGCIEVSMDNTLETLKSMEADKFANMIESTDIANKMLTENFTIFAPINDAMVDFEEEAENNEILDSPPTKDFSYLVGGHMVGGLLTLGHLKDDEVFQSVNGKTTIRINKYRSPTRSFITANCVPVTSKNNMATNGIVHLVANLLPLPRKTVGDIITANPKLSVFSKLLTDDGELLRELENDKQSWTLFVPTDKAFQNMDSNMLQRLLTGEGCVQSVLKQHIAKGTICSSGITEPFGVKNALGKPLVLSHDEVNTLRVEDVKVSHTDVLGTNGVVHFIDEVLIPSEGQNVLESLKKSDRQDLLKLIKLANLEPAFENLQNVTFFAPSKDAIKAISNETMDEWIENPDKLQEVLLYHLVAPQIKASNFKHNQELVSLAEDHSVRMQLHEMFPGIAFGATAQCSMVVKHDNEVCGAVLHSVDKVLAPPKGSIMDSLKSMKGHDTLIKMLESTDLESKLSSEDKGPYTLLAPTDEAFDHRFDSDSKQKLMENKTRVEQFLRMHILPEALCCSGVLPVFPFRHHYVRTLDGNLVSLHRSTRGDRVRFGPARAVHCDTMSRNGIIHSVNRVILPKRRPVTSLFDMDIFAGLFK